MEFLSPGVFIEEVPSQVQIVAAASTSNMGTAGFAERGPSDEATLVTSFDSYTKMFGGFVRDSFMPLSVAAFFQNGGRRAYVVRVTPADAVAASAELRSQITTQQIETGDGSTVSFIKTASTSLLQDNGGTSPIVASSVSIKWRKAGTPVSAQATRKRDGTTALVAVPSQAAYEGRLHPTTSLPTLDPDLDSVVPGTVTLKIPVAAGTGASGGIVSIACSTLVSGSIYSGTGGAGANTGVAQFDHITGLFSILFTGDWIPAGGDVGAINADFTPATATVTAVDDGAGAITGAGGVSSITYADGAYTLLATGNAPHNFAKVLATYKIKAWALTPVSAGAWANDVRVRVTGNADSYDITTAQFTKYNLQVLLGNSLGYETKETYEELDFSSATSAQYLADVLNDMSDYVNVTEPGSLASIMQLNGIARSAVVIAGGDALAGSQIVTATLLNTTIVPRTLSITWVDSTGATKTISDNGSGTLTGDVDGTGTNTINYTTGALALKTSGTIKGGTLVKVAYVTTPAETAHVEDFGDTTFGYTVGADGTFDAANYGRAQFTALALSAGYSGIYALNRVDEIMQVVLPDFAGDITVTGDLLDYVDGRESLPSGGDRFLILTVPQGSSAQEAVEWFRYDLNRTSKYAALYWPWIRVADPLSDSRPLLMPPMGHIAGIYARTDATKNVGKAPAGTVDGALRFLLGLEMIPSQGERDLVAPNKINSLVSGTSTGLAVWGARTMSAQSEWQYINVRRLFMFLEKSIYNATAWVVFENNNPNLWARVKAQLNGFLNSLFVDGYFAGKTPDQAYFVTVDSSNNDQSTIDAGQLIIDIGVAPNKPAEFVRFRMQQIASGT